MPAPDNKYARQAEQNSKKNKGEEKINIDVRLARLEEDIRRLKIEYDIFFNGGSKRAPFDTRNRIETAVKRLSDERSLTFTQRYQYNSIVARYSSLKEVWRRTIQAREEGRDAATLARAALAEQEKADEEEIPDEGKNAAALNFPIVFICGGTDAALEADTVRKIYEALTEAKRRCGEKSDELSFDQFKEQFSLQTERFKQKMGCRRVSFEIGIEDGNAVFKARAKPDE